MLCRVLRGRLLLLFVRNGFISIVSLICGNNVALLLPRRMLPESRIRRFFPRRVPPKRTMRFQLSVQPLSAETTCEIGANHLRQLPLMHLLQAIRLLDFLPKNLDPLQQLMTQPPLPNCL